MRSPWQGPPGPRPTRHAPGPAPGPTASPGSDRDLDPVVPLGPRRVAAPGGPSPERAAAAPVQRGGTGPGPGWAAAGGGPGRAGATPSRGGRRGRGGRDGQGPPRIRRRWRRPARRGRWWRPAPRQVAAGVGAVALALLSGALGTRPAAPAPAGAGQPAGTVVLALTRDLPAGAVPGPADLRRVRLPEAAVPADSIPAGRAVGPLALAVRRGDVLTRRQLGDGWAPAAGLRAFALPVGDGVEAGPLGPGDHVDVLAAARGSATTVVRAAPVLRVVPAQDGRAGQVVLGVDAGQAEVLAAARAAGPLTLVQAPP